MQPTPSKTLGDHQRKEEGIKNVLFNLLQQNINVDQEQQETDVTVHIRNYNQNSPGVTCYSGFRILQSLSRNK